MAHSWVRMPLMYDILIDYDIKEAIDIQNNQIDSFQYELSKLLAE